jgi:hypothetical protein
MACVDYTTWNNAKVACQNLQASVRGLGQNYTAMRGLGDLAVSAAASSSTDPCAIAAQTPCPAQPPALKAAPPPIVCGAGFFKTCNPQPCHCAPADTTVMTPTTPASVTSTGGFSQWGLLAVLAVGGFVVYKVATHKKASS